MTITLSAETERLIAEHVTRGAYASPDDVVRAGLESLRHHEAGGDFAPGELDALLAEGEKSGPSLDGERVLAELGALRADHGGESK